MRITVRGSRRSWVRTRRVVAAAATGVTALPPRAGGRRLRDRRAGALLECVRAPGRQEAALSQQQEVVASLGLVHHVTGHQERTTSTGEIVEERPEVTAEHGI